MLKIAALLNHDPKSSSYDSPSLMQRPLTPTDTNGRGSSIASPSPYRGMPYTPPARQSKMSKKFEMTRSMPTLAVNYQPWECSETHSSVAKETRIELAEKHNEFQIHPRGGADGLIGDYIKTLPYNSDKKRGVGNAGRTKFELFKYTFTMPDTNNEYLVLWDYHVGLVRITPFFKALGHPKTAPNKALKANPGLFELSHSITGGCIDAQGYWIPFQCAYSLCANFCWEIRWVLTPLFEPGFVHDCISPEHPDFGKFLVSSEAVRVCTLNAEHLSADNASVRLDTPMSNVDPFLSGSSSSKPDRQQRKKLPARKSRAKTKVYVDTTSSDTSTADAEEILSFTERESPPVSPRSSTPNDWLAYNNMRESPALFRPMYSDDTLMTPVTYCDEGSRGSLSPSAQAVYRSALPKNQSRPLRLRARQGPTSSPVQLSAKGDRTRTANDLADGKGNAKRQRLERDPSSSSLDSISSDDISAAHTLLAMAAATLHC